MLYLTAMTYALCFFVVTVSDSPGGKIEFAGTTRSLKIGDSTFIIPVIVKADSDFILQCDASLKRDGYITPSLDILVYVNIQGCDITAYRTFG